MFVFGISRLGPSRASIVSAVQPALTPVLAFAVFGDRLGAAQVLGAVLVVAGVVVLEARRVRSRTRSPLSWLPRQERWTLRQLASTKRVPSGTRLLRHGASADGFFLIVRGRATVIRDERRVDHGPCQFFGEIALLEDVPRTASVVASTDLTLKVIAKRDFATVGPEMKLEWTPSRRGTSVSTPGFGPARCAGAARRRVRRGGAPVASTSGGCARASHRALSLPERSVEIPEVGLSEQEFSCLPWLSCVGVLHMGASSGRGGRGSSEWSVQCRRGHRVAPDPRDSVAVEVQVA